MRDYAHFAMEYGLQPIGINEPMELDLDHKRQMAGSLHRIYFPES